VDCIETLFFYQLMFWGFWEPKIALELTDFAKLKSYIIVFLYVKDAMENPQDTAK